jgi:hypothetical protein
MDLTERILAAYRGVPGLRLTTTQAGRLWASAPEDCERALNHLVTAGYLYVDTRGQYAWHGQLAGGRPAEPHGGMRAVHGS